MAVLDATVGASTSNSYLTTAEAEELLSIRFGTDSWDKASNTDREKSLMLATQMIDECPILGFKVDSNQSLQFPRLEQEQATSAIPPEIRQACALQALAILKNPETCGATDRQVAQQSGVKQFQIGNFSETYQRWGSSAAVHLCVDAQRLLRGWIKRGGQVLGPGDEYRMRRSNWPWL